MQKETNLTEFKRAIEKILNAIKDEALYLKAITHLFRNCNPGNGKMYYIFRDIRYFRKIFIEHINLNKAEVPLMILEKSDDVPKLLFQDIYGASKNIFDDIAPENNIIYNTNPFYINYYKTKLPVNELNTCSKRTSNSYKLNKVYKMIWPAIKNRYGMNNTFADDHRYHNDKRFSVVTFNKMKCLYIISAVEALIKTHKGFYTDLKKSLIYKIPKYVRAFIFKEILSHYLHNPTLEEIILALKYAFQIGYISGSKLLIDYLHIINGQKEKAFSFEFSCLVEPRYIEIENFKLNENHMEIIKHIFFVHAKTPITKEYNISTSDIMMVFEGYLNAINEKNEYKKQLIGKLIADIITKEIPLKINWSKSKSEDFHRNLYHKTFTKAMLQYVKEAQCKNYNFQVNISKWLRSVFNEFLPTQNTDIGNPAWSDLLISSCILTYFNSWKCPQSGSDYTNMFYLFSSLINMRKTKKEFSIPLEKKTFLYFIYIIIDLIKENPNFINLYTKEQGSLIWNFFNTMQVLNIDKIDISLKQRFSSSDSLSLSSFLEDLLSIEKLDFKNIYNNNGHFFNILQQTLENEFDTLSSIIINRAPYLLDTLNLKQPLLKELQNSKCILNQKILECRPHFFSNEQFLQKNKNLKNRNLNLEIEKKIKSLTLVEPSIPIFLQKWYYAALAIILCIILPPVIIVFAVLMYRYYTKLNAVKENNNQGYQLKNILKARKEFMFKKAPDEQEVFENIFSSKTSKLSQYENEIQSKEPKQLTQNPQVLNPPKIENN